MWLVLRATLPVAKQRDFVCCRIYFVQVISRGRHQNGGNFDLKYDNVPRMENDLEIIEFYQPIENEKNLYITNISPDCEENELYVRIPFYRSSIVVGWKGGG